MGNRVGGRRRRPLVDECYTQPQGLYPHPDIDLKKLRRLILEAKLAPCHPCADDPMPDLDEFPICFLFYPSLNRPSATPRGFAPVVWKPCLWEFQWSSGRQPLSTRSVCPSPMETRRGSRSACPSLHSWTSSPMTCSSSTTTSNRYQRLVLKHMLYQSFQSLCIVVTAWAALDFKGRYVFRLRSELASQMGMNNVSNLIMCVQAGTHGQPNPLIANLPRGSRTLYIVVAMAGEPGPVTLHRCLGHHAAGAE